MQNFNQAPAASNINQFTTFDFVSPENLARMYAPVTEEEMSNRAKNLKKITSGFFQD